MSSLVDAPGAVTASLEGKDSEGTWALDTNFRGWRRVWGEPGENRGGTGGEAGAPKRTGGEPGAFGKRTGGFWHSCTKSTEGEAGALGQEPRENRGEEFSLKQETQLRT